MAPGLDTRQKHYIKSSRRKFAPILISPCFTKSPKTKPSQQSDQQQGSDVQPRKQSQTASEPPVGEQVQFRVTDWSANKPISLISCGCLPQHECEPHRAGEHAGAFNSSLVVVVLNASLCQC